LALARLALAFVRRRAILASIFAVNPAFQHRRLRFGVFEADLSSHELHKHGIRMRIQDQPFQILETLLERPGELVSRDELYRKLWPDHTFVDFEAGLNAAVRRLRDVLDDSPEEPRYLETLPRLGYRFIAAVEMVRWPERPVAQMGPESSNATPITLQVTADGQTARKSHSAKWRIPGWRWAITCGVSVLIGAGAVSWRLGVFGPQRTDAIHAIAVLPLQNLSGDASQDYLAEGMTEALITDLAQSKSLRVISRTSSMRYGNAKKTLPEIAKELKVDAIVEGSVTRVGNRIRIDAQLINGHTDRHLWARSFEGELKNILAVQMEIARAISVNVEGKLSPQEQARLAKSLDQVNPEAYEAFLKGRYYWNKRSLDGFNKGLAFFQQALRADPTYAPAYAGIANCHNFLGLGMGPEPPKEEAKRAKAAAQRALELDKDLAEAHGALGFTLYRYDWDWSAAEQEYRRALELDPHNVIIRGWFTDLLSFLGRAEEAHAQREQLHDFDLHSIQTVRSVAGAYGAAGHHDKAIDYYKRAIESEPDSFRLRMDLGGDYLQAGRYQDATEEFQTVLSLYGPNVYPLARLGYTYALWGKKAEAERVLGQLKKEGRVGYVSYAVAQIYDALGRKEQALTWLEKAYDEGAAQMIGLRGDFGSLRSDPRFQDLARRVRAPAQP